MSNPTDITGERKFRLGVDNVFEWVAPGPIYSTIGPPAIAAPSLTLVKPKGGGSSVVALTQIHADLSVTACAADLRTLTITAAAGTDGLQGRYGIAQLVTVDEGVFPVVITRINGTSLSLAEQLPRKLSLTSTAALKFSTYTGTVLAAFTSSALRNVEWQVTYAERHGANAPALLNLRQQGLCHFVAQPFQTGLTHQKFLGYVAGLGETVPRNQQDWSAQLQAGFDELVGEIRKQLQPQGLTEDAIPAAFGTRLDAAQVSFALAAILDFHDREKADRFRAQGKTRVDDALRQIYIDTNGDNVVDDGEDDVPLTAPTAEFASLPTFATPTFLGRR